jgi:hypothetical protein
MNIYLIYALIATSVLCACAFTEDLSHVQKQKQNINIIVLMFKINVQDVEIFYKDYKIRIHNNIRGKIRIRQTSTCGEMECTCSISCTKFWIQILHWKISLKTQFKQQENNIDVMSFMNCTEL